MIKNVRFPYKISNRRLMFRKIERVEQNEIITKNRVLPVITLIFWNILFQFKNFLSWVDLVYQLPRYPYSFILFVRKQITFSPYFPLHGNLSSKCLTHMKTNLGKCPSLYFIVHICFKFITTLTIDQNIKEGKFTKPSVWKLG